MQTGRKLQRECTRVRAKRAVCRGDAALRCTIRGRPCARKHIFSYLCSRATSLEPAKNVLIMYAILINALAVVVGSAIGALARKGIREKYVTVLNTAMGLAALVLGANVAMANMQKSNYPALFIVCLALGGLVGTMMRLDQRMERAVKRASGNSNLAEGITTGVLFCCVGTLSMMGPVLSALYGDNTYLLTCALLNLVTMIAVSSSYGFGTAVTAVAVFAWQSMFYGIAHVSAAFISEELIAEVSVVGGVLIAAAGLGVLNIKDCRTINLLPALAMPLLFFLLKGLIGNIVG